MDEVLSNQDNPELRPFLGHITEAMFANYLEQSAGTSSPEMGLFPVTERRPPSSQVALHDMTVVGRNRLGAGILENSILFDDQSLTSAFQDIRLSFADGAADSAASSGCFAFRDGLYPASPATSSPNSTRNGSLQLAFAQDGFVPPSLMFNNAEHMKPNFAGQNPQVYTGMNGSDNAYGTAINLPSPSPFQQHYFVDGWSQGYVPCQQVNSKFRWHAIDVDRYSVMQNQQSCQQVPQIAGSDAPWIGSGQGSAVQSTAKSAASHHLRTPSVHNLGNGSADIYRNGDMIPSGENLLNSTRVNNCPCLLYPDCSCETCEYCQIQKSENLKHLYGRCSPKSALQNQIFDKFKPKGSPEKILMKSEGVNSINIKPGFALKGVRSKTNKKTNHHLNIQDNDSLQFDSHSSQSLSPLGSESELIMNSVQLKYNSVDEVVEELFLLAKDQNGCRFLQKMFTEGSQENAQKVFDGVIEHIDELMVDPFGNYLVQKLLEECNDDQKMHIFYEITKIPGHLIKVSCNMHGTRVVQKVIETINTSDEVSMVVSALSQDTITLMMDANGSHVAHRCLQKLSPEYKAFLINAAIEYCFELSKDRQGCCIIQKCILHANKEQKNRFLYNITSRALDLAEHQYGNYVIQYVLELNIKWATDEILDKLSGHYGYLSMQKCSSNVVEKCLKEAQEPSRAKIIHELISDPKLRHILLDQYGNYVIQTALRECEDAAVHAALVGAIKPHAAALRNNMFGKRVLSKACLKNRKY